MPPALSSSKYLFTYKVNEILSQDNQCPRRNGNGLTNDQFHDAMQFSFTNYVINLLCYGLPKLLLFIIKGYNNNKYNFVLIFWLTFLLALLYTSSSKEITKFLPSPEDTERFTANQLTAFVASQNSLR
jgi:hypothetical protein